MPAPTLESQLLADLHAHAHALHAAIAALEHLAAVRDRTKVVPIRPEQLPEAA